MAGFPDQHELFEGAHSFDDDGAAGGFVKAEGLHAHLVVLHKVDAAYAVAAGSVVESEDKVGAVDPLAIERDGAALGEGERDFFGLVRSGGGVSGEHPGVGGRGVPGVLDGAALVTDVPEVA